MTEYPNEDDSEDTKTNKISTIHSFLHKILSDDEIEESINSSNSKQRKVFNMDHTWSQKLFKR